MYSAEESRTITEEGIRNYTTTLQEDEKSPATVAKYVYDLNMAAEYFAGEELTKLALVGWKDALAKKYATDAWYFKAIFP